MTTDKARLVSYIEWELKDKLKELAAAEGRSMSNMLEQLVKRAEPAEK